MCPVANVATDWERLEALGGGNNYGYNGEFDSQPGSSDYDYPRDYQEWCDWSDVDDYDGYYDPFQPRIEGEFVSPGNAFGMVTDTVVVASVMCAGNHVDLRVSEGPGLSDNIKPEPGSKSPESGDVSHVSVLGGIVDNGLKGPSPVSGDASDLPVSVRMVVSGPARAGARGARGYIGTAGLLCGH